LTFLLFFTAKMLTFAGTMLPLWNQKFRKPNLIKTYNLSFAVYKESYLFIVVVSAF